jgi:hypothetical protein
LTVCENEFIPPPPPEVIQKLVLIEALVVKKSDFLIKFFWTDSET